MKKYIGMSDSLHNFKIITITLVNVGRSLLYGLVGGRDLTTDKKVGHGEKTVKNH